MENIKAEVLFDFEGTISLEVDTTLWMIGALLALKVVERWSMLMLKEICLTSSEIMCECYRAYSITHTQNVREAVWKLWDSIGLTWNGTWNECLDLDAGFQKFHDYCKEKGYPITIVSSQVLIFFLGEQANDIDIITNSSKVDGRKEEIIYRDDTKFRNDKSLALLKARKNTDSNTIFAFCGDGLSDISAAKHSNLPFARNGKSLAEYCKKEKIPFIGFDSFPRFILLLKIWLVENQNLKSILFLATEK